MSRLWAKLFGRAPAQPEETAETVEVQALAPEPLAPPEVTPQPKAAEPEPQAVEGEPEPQAAEPEPEPQAAEPEPEPQAVEREPEPRAAAPEPVVKAGPADAPTAADVEARLGELLDSLGSAHRRPFVRNG